MKIVKGFWSKIKKNMGLKILALFSAFVIWLGVENYLDPIDITVFYNVPVESINVSSLTELDKIPEIIEGKEITVAVQARKSICDKITKADIIAIADYEKISRTDTVPIEVSVKGYTESDVEIVRGNDQYMKLSLEDYAEKEFRIKVSVQGKPIDGYVVGSEVASPNVIKVSGSRLTLSRIQEVVVEVDADYRKADFRVSCVPIVYDMNNDVISNSNLTFSTDQVNVSVDVLKTKLVNLRVTEAGSPLEGYELTDISFQPLTILVAGEENVLSQLDSFDTVINIDGCKANVEETKDLADLFETSFPDLKIVDEDTKLAITAYISEQKTKQIPISADEIALVNLPDGLCAKVLSLSSNGVLLRAPKGWLDSLNIAIISPTIELTGVESEGQFTVKVHFNKSDFYQIMNEITATVAVTRDATEEAGAFGASSDDNTTGEGQD